MPEGNGTVALAFSGGLDTTVCVSLLKEEYGYDEVIGVTVDVGQPDYEFEEAQETAEALGVEQHVVDAKAEFADLCLEAVKPNGRLPAKDRDHHLHPHSLRIHLFKF
jgi:argininosuccinate synthase